MLKCLNICSPAWKVVEPLGDDEAELEEVWGLIVIAHVDVSRALYSVSINTANTAVYGSCCHSF